MSYSMPTLGLLACLEILTVLDGAHMMHEMRALQNGSAVLLCQRLVVAVQLLLNHVECMFYILFLEFETTEAVECMVF